MDNSRVRVQLRMQFVAISKVGAVRVINDDLFRSQSGQIISTYSPRSPYRMISTQTTHKKEDDGFSLGIFLIILLHAIRKSVGVNTHKVAFIRKRTQLEGFLLVVKARVSLRTEQSE